MKSALSTFHLPSLDGFRAISIGIVFAAHAGWGHLVPGGLGVTIFFFLSGFLISSLLRREYARSESVNIKNFYIRRAIRILPLFYITLTAAGILAATGVLPGSISTKGMLALGLHLGNYVQIFFPEYAIPQGSGVYWSLAVEEHYYLTFPFLAVLLLRAKSRSLSAWTLAGLAFAVLGWRIFLVQRGAPEIRTYYASDTRVDSILWGALLAFCMNPKLDPPPAHAEKLRLPLLTLSAGLTLFSLVYRDETFRETFRYTIQGVALLPVFYYAVSAPERLPFRWLNGRIISYVGALSYTLYLVHHLAIYAVGKQLSQWPLVFQALVALGISLALAALSYRFLEGPLAKVRKKYN